MVINAWPILILVPLTTYRHVNDLARRHTSLVPAALRWKHTVRIAALGIAAAIVVYLLTNPYVLFNALVNREILRSNFGNSLAMYEIARIGEGFVRVLELTVEGATWPVVVLGVIALVVGLVRRNTIMLPLAVPGLLFFLQFVLIGAGKPGEYGRFGIFANTALCIGAARLLSARWLGVHWLLRWMLPGFVVVWVASFGSGYLRGFRADAKGDGSRMRAAEQVGKRAADLEEISGSAPVVALSAEPAPYACPPLRFASLRVFLVSPSNRDWERTIGSHVLLRPMDGAGARLTEALRQVFKPDGAWAGWSRETPISWANKPFEFTFRE
jgi:hypothetical protein